MTSRSSRDSCTAAFCLFITMIAGLALAISWFVPLPGPALLASSATVVIGALVGAVDTYRHARGTNVSMLQAGKDAISTAAGWVFFWL